MSRRSMRCQLERLESRTPTRVPTVKFVHGDLPAVRDPNVLYVHFRKDWCGNNAHELASKINAAQNTEATSGEPGAESGSVGE